MPRNPKTQFELSIVPTFSRYSPLVVFLLASPGLNPEIKQDGPDGAKLTELEFENTVSQMLLATRSILGSSAAEEIAWAQVCLRRFFDFISSQEKGITDND